MASRSNTTVTIVTNNFASIARRLPVEAMEVVADTLIDIDVAVQTGMAAGGGGRIYIRRGRTHQASAPGQMPATDTGNLAGSMQHELDRSKGVGYYYTSVEYAPYLEYGTTRMLARPFLTPAAERARPRFIRRMSNLESRLR